MKNTHVRFVYIYKDIHLYALLRANWKQGFLHFFSLVFTLALLSYISRFHKATSIVTAQLVSDRCSRSSDV